MRTERQADMTQLIVAFRNFANAPKNNRTNIVNDTNVTDKNYDNTHFNKYFYFLPLSVTVYLLCV